MTVLPKPHSNLALGSSPTKDWSWPYDDDDLPPVDFNRPFRPRESSDPGSQTIEIFTTAGTAEKTIKLFGNTAVEIIRPNLQASYLLAMNFFADLSSNTLLAYPQQNSKAITDQARAALERLLSGIDMDDDESAKQIREAIENVVYRFGTNGLSGIRSFISDSRSTAEVRQILLLAIAQIDDAETRDARRELIAYFLGSSDVALRYSAVGALGSLGGEHSKLLLSQLSKKELNRAILALIRAHLR
jgi:hypothetical protein